MRRKTALLIIAVLVTALLALTVLASCNNRLLAPSGLAVTDNGNGNTIIWNAVDRALYYEIDISDHELATTEGTSFELPSDLVVGNVYVIRVRAIASRSRFTSDYAVISYTPSADIQQKTTLAKPTVNLVTNMLYWSTVPYAGSYRIYCDDDIIATVSSSITTLDLSSYIVVEDDESHSFIIYVVAVPSDTTLYNSSQKSAAPSPYVVEGGSVRLTPISLPANIIYSINEDDGHLYLKWTPIYASVGYVITFAGFGGSGLVDTPITAPNTTLSANGNDLLVIINSATVTSFDLQSIPFQGSFELRLHVLGDKTTVYEDSAPSRTFSFPISNIAAPENLKTVGNTLTWDKADYSAGYVVSTTNLDTGNESVSSILTDTSFSLTNIDGRYSVRVRTAGDQIYYTDSVYSTEIVYEVSGGRPVARRLDTPTDFTFENNKLSWTPSEYAVGYKVKITAYYNDTYINILFGVTRTFHYDDSVQTVVDQTYSSAEVDMTTIIQNYYKDIVIEEESTFTYTDEHGITHTEPLPSPIVATYDFLRFTISVQAVSDDDDLLHTDSLMASELVMTDQNDNLTLLMENLNSPENVYVNGDGLYWTPVIGVASYDVEITYSDGTVEVFNTLIPSLSESKVIAAGDFLVRIKSRTATVESPYGRQIAFKLPQMLDTPQDVYIKNEVVRWNDVLYASGYVVTYNVQYVLPSGAIGSTDTFTSGVLLTAEYNLSLVEDGIYNIRVYAVGDGSIWVDSLKSREVVYTKTDGNYGTQTKPYEIGTASDLSLLGMYPDAYFVLIADINLNGITLMPIGNDAAPFTGTFDGNNHKISNFLLAPSEDSGNVSYVGFFGYMRYATISNLTFENVTISCDRFNELYVGTIAGRALSSTISNVDCLDITLNVNGENGGYSAYIGGAVGQTDSQIDNCDIYGAITVSGVEYTYVGGLVGYTSGTLSNGTFGNQTNTSSISVSNGVNSFIGGIAGSINNSSAQLTQLATVCDITALAISNAIRLGGIAGNANINAASNLVHEGALTIGEKASADTIGDVSLGGLFGDAYGVTLKDSSHDGNIALYNYDGVATVGGLSGTSQFDSVSSVSVEGDIEVESSASTYNTYVGGLFGENSADLYEVGYDGDITVNASNVYVAGLVASLLQGGIFGEAGEPIIYNGEIRVNGTNSYVGGIVAVASGSEIDYVVNETKITVTSNDTAYLGGIVARLAGSISNSYSLGSIDVMDRMLVASNVYIGGLVAFAAYSEIERSYSATAIDYVSHYGYVGGLGGYMDTVTLSNAYSAANVTVDIENGYVGGLYGYSVSSVFSEVYVTGRTASDAGSVGSVFGSVSLSRYEYFYADSGMNVARLAGIGITGGIEYFDFIGSMTDELIGFDPAIWSFSANSYPTLIGFLGQDITDEVSQQNKEITIDVSMTTVGTININDDVSVEVKGIFKGISWKQTSGTDIISLDELGNIRVYNNGTATVEGYVAGGLLTTTITITTINLPVLGGDGTQGNPYVISDPSLINQLFLSPSAYFVFSGNEMDFSGVNWQTIGTITMPFQGHIDFNNIELRNITLDSEGGLFGYLVNAEIKNLTLTQSTFTASVSSTNSYIGIIASSAIDTTFENISITDTLLTVNGENAVNVSSFVANIVRCSLADIFVNTNVEIYVTADEYRAAGIAVELDSSTVVRSGVESTISANGFSRKYLSGFVHNADASTISESYANTALLSKAFGITFVSGFAYGINSTSSIESAYSAGYFNSVESYNTYQGSGFIYTNRGRIAGSYSAFALNNVDTAFAFSIVGEFIDCYVLSTKDRLYGNLTGDMYGITEASPATMMSGNASVMAGLDGTAFTFQVGSYPRLTNVGNQIAADIVSELSIDIVGSGYLLNISSYLTPSSNSIISSVEFNKGSVFAYGVLSTEVNQGIKLADGYDLFLYEDGVYNLILTFDGGATVSINLTVQNCQPLFTDGIGKEGDPFVVSNIEELQNTSSFSRAQFILASDIDGNNEALSPLFDVSNPFSGKLSGQHHSIYNFKLTDYSLGLFGIMYGAIIEDLTLRNIAIDIVSTTVVSQNPSYTQNNGEPRYLFDGGEVSACVFAAEISGSSVVNNVAISSVTVTISADLSVDFGFFALSINESEMTNCSLSGCNLNVTLNGASYTTEGLYDVRYFASTARIGGFVTIATASTLSRLSAVGSSMDVYVKAGEGTIGGVAASSAESVSITDTALLGLNISTLSGEDEITAHYMSEETNLSMLGGIIGTGSAALSNVAFSSSLTSISVYSNVYIGGIAARLSGDVSPTGLTFGGAISVEAYLGTAYVGGLIGESVAYTVTNATVRGTVNVCSRELTASVIDNYKALSHLPYKDNYQIETDSNGVAYEGKLYVGGAIGDSLSRISHLTSEAASIVNAQFILDANRHITSRVNSDEAAVTMIDPIIYVGGITARQRGSASATISLGTVTSNTVIMEGARVLSEMTGSNSSVYLYPIAAVVGGVFGELLSGTTTAIHSKATILVDYQFNGNDRISQDHDFAVFVGGISGVNYTEMSDLLAEGSISATTSSNVSAVIGSLAGYNESTIQRAIMSTALSAVGPVDMSTIGIAIGMNELVLSENDEELLVSSIPVSYLSFAYYTVEHPYDIIGAGGGKSMVFNAGYKENLRTEADFASTESEYAIAYYKALIGNRLTQQEYEQIAMISFYDYSWSYIEGSLTLDIG